MPVRKKMRSAIVVLWVLSLCCPAWAAEPVGAPDLARAEALVREGKAAESFQLLAPFEFEHSGNADFDYWYGVSALESGRPDLATLALERVLTVNPDFVGARLDLARAYFALGDTERARTEFNTVLGQDPPPAARATIDRYLAEMDRRTEVRGLRWSAYLDLTVGRDSNVNNSTSQGLLFVPLFGLSFTLAPTSLKTADQYVSAGGGFEVTAPLTDLLSAFAGVDYKERINQKQDTFDFSQLDGRVGLQHQTQRNSYRAAVSHGEFRLDHHRHQ